MGQQKYTRIRVQFI